MWKQTASSGGEGNFEKAPVGNHQAVLVAMIDLGIQKTEYQGDVKYPHRVYFCWELVSEQDSKGNNFLIGIDLTYSMTEKSKLRQWIESLAGKKLAEGQEFDFTKLIGKPCLLSVTDNKGYPKVNGMGAVPKGMAVPPAKNTPLMWSCDDIGPDGAINLPSWLPFLYGESLADHIKRRVIDKPKQHRSNRGDAHEPSGETNYVKEMEESLY